MRGEGVRRLALTDRWLYGPSHTRSLNSSSGHDTCLCWASAAVATVLGGHLAGDSGALFIVLLIFSANVLRGSRPTLPRLAEWKQSCCTSLFLGHCSHLIPLDTLHQKVTVGQKQVTFEDI